MEIVRLQQEMTSQMREEAEARDRLLMQSLDERDQRTRDWRNEEADRRDEIMIRQMLDMVKTSRRGPNNGSGPSHPDRRDDPPALP